MRDVQELHYGSDRADVLEKLGDPSNAEFKGSSEMLTYTLQKGSKFWQVLLAIPTCGINLLFTQKYEIILTDSKIDSITPVAGGSRGLAAISALFQGMGQGLQNAGTQSQTVNCTSNTYGNTTNTSCH